MPFVSFHGPLPPGLSAPAAVLRHGPQHPRLLPGQNDRTVEVPTSDPPRSQALLSRHLPPGLELALLLALIIASPARFNRESRVLRAANLTLTVLLSVANAWSTTVLVVGTLTGRLGRDVAPLLSTAAAILLTNIIALSVLSFTSATAFSPTDVMP